MGDLSPALGGPDQIEADAARAYPNDKGMQAVHEVLALRRYLGQASDHHAPILVWEFHKAPPALQALSEHGGDEDWLALVPAGKCYDDWRGYGPPRWIEALGVCDVSEHKIQVGHNESRVYIGAHA